MSDIQNIAITATQTVAQPKPHTTYTIQISTPIRTWTVSRRYNDFVSLHAELLSSTSKEPPAPLPPKHTFSITRAVYDDKIIRERRVLLEQYLRAILTTKDSRWRSSFAFADFLAVPNPRAGPSSATGESAAPDHWSATTWLSEQSSIAGILRNVRSALLKRDALAGMGDAGGSRSASVEAKKLLKDIDARIAGLVRGLVQIGDGLGEGEKRRREEMVENLKAERGNLGRMADAGVRTAMSSAARDASPTMPGGTSLWAPPAAASGGRVFGRKAEPQETEVTRPLDDRGLLQLQATQVSDQDAQLGELSKVLQRQRQMGELIHQEIGEQNELLDEIESGVDNTGRKLGRAKRDLNKISKQ